MQSLSEHLSQFVVPARGGIPVPPRGFRKPRGQVLAGRFAFRREIPFGGWPQVESPAGLTKAQQAGLRYEAKALDHLAGIFPNILIQPWIRYEDKSGVRFCCPDALILHKGHVTIVEVKLSHSVQAYWQLRHHYWPVVSKLCEHWKINVLEVCRTLDPHIAFPEPQLLVYDPVSFVLHGPGIYGVMKWRT